MGHLLVSKIFGELEKKKVVSEEKNSFGQLSVVGPATGFESYSSRLHGEVVGPNVQAGGFGGLVGAPGLGTGAGVQMQKHVSELQTFRPKPGRLPCCCVFSLMTIPNTKYK